MNLLQLLTNPYTLTFLIAVITNLILILYVLYRGNNSTALLTFIFYSSGTLIMGIGQMMATISYQPRIFEFWNSLFLLAIVAFPATILVFTLVFLGRQNLLKNFLFWLLILIPTFTGAYLVLRGGNTLVVNNFNFVKNYPWGLQVAAEGKFAYLIIIWYQICFLTSLALLIKYIRKTQNKVVKKQIWLLIVAVVIPFIGGVLTQGVLPQFHIRIFPVGIPLNTINACIIAYALLKYGSSVIDPDAIASSVTKIMHNGLVVIDAKGFILLTNPFIEQFLGYKEHELVGKEIRSIFPDSQTYTEFEDRNTAVLSGQETMGGEEMVVVSSTGERLPVNIYTSNYQDKFNGAQAKILVLADIQKLKSLQEQLRLEKQGVEQKVEERTYELKEERAKLEASIKGLSLGFVMVDEQLSLLTINEAARHILLLNQNTSTSDVGMNGSHKNFLENNPSALLRSSSFHKGVTFSLNQKEIIPEPSQNIKLSLEAIVERLKASLDLEAEIKRCLADKRPINFKEVVFEGKFLKILITPITLDHFLEAVGSVVVIEDITEEKNIERSKDEFFSLASHELRTPLTAVKGYISIMKRYFLQIISKKPEIDKIIGIIEISTNRLIDIVNDFIDTFALEQKKIIFKKDSFDPEIIIKEVIGEFQQLAKDKSLDLKYIGSHTNTLVVADESKLKQILVNLISNSLKFTQKGRVAISTLKAGNFLEVRIEDTGKGISLKLQNLLFKKFQQAVEDIYTRDGFQQGTGLGLYISRLLVEGMGGTINLVSSEVNKGSVFAFTIPVAK